MNDAAVICLDCGTGNSDANAYCGGCGKRIARRGDGVTLHPGFKGPRRLLIASGVVFATSLVIGAASLFLIQASDPASVGLDFGGPIINGLLEAAHVSSVRAPGSPSDTVSFLIVGTFLLASLFGAASAFAGIAGGVWLLVRWRDSDGPAQLGTAVATAGDASRKRLEDAQRLGGKGLEKAKPVLAETAERSRRVAREGRAAFDEEVAPRVSTGIRQGSAIGREWIKAWRDRRRGGPEELMTENRSKGVTDGNLPPPGEGPTATGHRDPDGGARAGSE